MSHPASLYRQDQGKGSVSGKQLPGSTTKMRGTAEVTIQDQAGHRAEDTYQLTGSDGGAIRGTGYPFDPNTGRVL